MATILVVDDEAANRDLVEYVLRARGHRTLQAEGALAALVMLRTSHADLVLSDIQMPGMDGYELARVMRSDPALAAIPILFYSSSLVYEIGTEADQYSTHPIVTKNGDIRSLVDAIDDALAPSMIE